MQSNSKERKSKTTGSGGTTPSTSQRDSKRRYDTGKTDGPKREITYNGEGQLATGTIDAIVSHLLDQVVPPIFDPTVADEAERARKIDAEQTQMLQVFIISYRQFVSPTRFFLILEHRFMASRTEASKYGVFKMLSVWLDKYLDRDFFFHDKGNRLFDQLLKFVSYMSREDVVFSAKANELKLLILRVKFRRASRARLTSPQAALMYTHNTEKSSKVSEEDDEEGPRASSSNPLNNGETGGLPTSQFPVPVIAMTSLESPKKPYSLCEMSLVALAEQLTLIERNMFRAIKEREFLNLNWKKPENKRNSRHIVKMVERFNKVSYWVATRIVRETDQKRRTSLLKRFIILAEKCAELNNYNTLMEVLAGLNLHPVQRLKETWKGLSEKYRESMETLERLMENKQNYKNYRDRLARVQETGESALPYLGVYLRDLTFIEEGNNTHSDEGLINFEKIQLVGQVIREVQYFQVHSQYAELKPSEEQTTIKYLRKLRGLRQEQLDEKSHLCEASKAPPPSAQTNNNNNSSSSTTHANSSSNGNSSNHHHHHVGATTNGVGSPHNSS
eukprot:TRINITY_DN1766_c0_g1_i1.p1 TRINITY_DN1766_c0_g1~~TRINITY_DN1766_c0_g1_i1.p1  ORF type:complete len:560 (+),score=114.31 TRINITY_DN1766_c0_g1_i1:215-1894(+)